jgi:nitroimidazol reductase NimA-like FMN-containing flavoprotein (pyridoxamine 5'-phosphate oxidase superfamily)
MPSLTSAELDEFLAEYRVVHVGTISADGSPYVVPGSFLYTGSAILLTPRGRSVWHENLVRDPRVSLSIDETVQPFRKVIVSGVRAEVLFAPGREKEWIDVKRKVELKGMSEEAADRYLKTVSQIPYALYSVPFEYPSPSVMTWKVVISGDDHSGMMAKRYGTLINPESDLSGFDGWKSSRSKSGSE